jgi:hypothetical protein
MTGSFLRISLGVMTYILFSACGQISPKERPPQANETPQLKEKEPVSNPDSSIYGVWEGGAADGSYHQKVRFKPDQMSIEKECHFPGKKSISISASGATFDGDSKSLVTLVGGLFSSLSLDGRNCTIEFPASLVFFVRSQKLYVSFQNEEKQTSLIKTL